MAKAEYKNAVRSRKMIQRALVALLQEKELDKITVTDIVTRADINRGTFYAHYTDISMVLDSIMEHVCQTLREALEKQLLWEKRPDARLILQHLQHMIEADLEFYRNAIRSKVSWYICRVSRTKYQCAIGTVRNRLTQTKSGAYRYISTGT